MSDPLSISPNRRPTSVAVRGDRGAALLAAVLAAAACAALVEHAMVGLSAPLWLDENWTGGLATASSLPELMRDMRDDPNAPAYYLLIWAWAKLFGLSNTALHLPGLVLNCAAPLVAWLGLTASRPRVALVWAAALGLWGPGILQAGYARCYPLLLVVAVLSCVTLVRMLDRPTRGRAIAWVASGALVVLTHYHGAVMIGLQGAALIAYGRGRALVHWPAALVALPALAWIAWHAPRLLLFARPEVAWYRLLAPAELPDALTPLVGVPRAELLVVAVALLLVEVLARRGRAADPAGRDAVPAIVGGVALAAALVFLALCCLRPLYSTRYLTSFAPGVLLLVATRLDAASRGRPDLLAMLVGGYALVTTTFWFDRPGLVERVFSYEEASAWVAQAAPRRLVFFWDNPTSTAMTARQLERAGGFFLRRAGLPVAVTAMPLRLGADMNGPLLAEADGRTAILWLSDTRVHDTSARSDPSRLAAAGTGLDCREFGDGPLGVLACRPGGEGRDAPRGDRRDGSARPGGA